MTQAISTLGFLLLFQAGGPAAQIPATQMKTDYAKVTGTDFFSAENYNGILQRLDKIRPDAEKKWGTMDVAQMLHHLNRAIGSGLGYYDLRDESNFLSRGIVQWLILDVQKKFPVGAATAPTLKVTATCDFEQEKAQLKEILAKAYATRTDSDWGRHTYFGKMSRKSWGKLIMIHCNHHFQQFSN